MFVNVVKETPWPILFESLNLTSEPFDAENFNADS